ncbi:MAG: hypothetical protein NTV97_12590 [Alphaproteobacteria bacterium]|nr:hypothetical protein [Alphaproteobacteria bacterium]
MGILLKLILFGVACYGIYSVARRWYGILGGTQQPKAPPPTPREAAPPPARPRPASVEETVQCAKCGAYISTSKAGTDCPHA